MHNDFDKVETELRQIEEDFETGRMNAFGSRASQDAFIRELRRIADIESQVFYKTCTILKAGNRSEHAVTTNMFASAEASGQGAPPGASAATADGMNSSGRFRGRGSGVPGASAERSPSAPFPMPNAGAALPLLRRGSLNPQGGVNLPRPLGHLADGNVANSFFAKPGSGRRSAELANDPSSPADGGADPRTGEHTAGTSTPRSNNNGNGNTASDVPYTDGSAALPDVWSNEAGYADAAFDDVIGHFQLLESEFEFVGDHLRQISRHVTRLNDMSDQVNNMDASNIAEVSTLHREATRARKRTADGGSSVTPSTTSRLADNTSL